MRQIVYLISLLLLYGCANDLTDIAFIDELKHPTKFPDIYQPDVLDIEKLLAENPLNEGEKLKVVPLGETKYASIQMMLVRSGVEVPTHYHEDHDEVMHIKKGSAVVILDGTRYYVEEGAVILVPRKSWHKVMNTDKEVYVAVSVFYPPYMGEDIKFVKEKKRKTKKRELEY
ncbi:MAG: cupin domain-containing protein [Candidatus Brocadiales bacterium]